MTPAHCQGKRGLSAPCAIAPFATLANQAHIEDPVQQLKGGDPVSGLSATGIPVRSNTQMSSQNIDATLMPRHSFFRADRLLGGPLQEPATMLSKHGLNRIMVGSRAFVRVPPSRAVANLRLPHSHSHQSFAKVSRRQKQIDAETTASLCRSISFGRLTTCNF